MLLRKQLTKIIRKTEFTNKVQIYNVKDRAKGTSSKGILNSKKFLLWNGKSIGIACRSHNPHRI